MPSLKGILFNQVAGEGLNHLVEELQTKYKPKKGRRFNHANITYEISRPALKDEALEFEISSKIPQDELKSEKDMDTYFSEIKKVVEGEKKKPVSIEMENIVWESKKDSEKERDYVKLLYSYGMSELYDDKEVMDRYENIRSGKSDELPPASGALTMQGRVVLQMVRERLNESAKTHIQTLIEANKKVREAEPLIFNASFSVFPRARPAVAGHGYHDRRGVHVFHPDEHGTFTHLDPGGGDRVLWWNPPLGQGRRLNPHLSSRP